MGIFSGAHPETFAKVERPAGQWTRSTTVTDFTWPSAGPWHRPPALPGEHIPSPGPLTCPPAACPPTDTGTPADRPPGLPCRQHVPPDPEGVPGLHRRPGPLAQHLRSARVARVLLHNVRPEPILRPGRPPRIATQSLSCLIQFDRQGKKVTYFFIVLSLKTAHVKDIQELQLSEFRCSLILMVN